MIFNPMVPRVIPRASGWAARDAAVDEDVALCITLTSGVRRVSGYHMAQPLEPRACQTTHTASAALHLAEREL